MRWINGAGVSALACLITLALCCCASEPSPVSPTASPAARMGVQLQPSFRVAQQADNPLSHAPSVLVTPDGERLVVATNTGEILIFDADSRERISRRRITSEPIATAALARGGKSLIVLTVKDELILADLTSGAVTARETISGAKSLAVSGDGSRIAVGSGSTVHVRSLPDLDQPRSLETGVKSITSVAWHPKLPRVGVTGTDGQLVLLDLEGAGILFTKKKSGPLHAIAFSPDGQQLAYGGEEKIVWVADDMGGSERVVSSQQPYWITTLSFSPDGEMLLYGDESCDIWLRAVASGKLIFHGKHHHECWVNQVAWLGGGESFLLACRPNNHAGAPTQVYQNVFVEAAQTGEVQEADAELRSLCEQMRAVCSSEEAAGLRTKLRELVGSNSQSALKDEDLLAAALGAQSGLGAYSIGDFDVELAQGALISGVEFRGLGNDNPGAVPLPPDVTLIGAQGSKLRGVTVIDSGLLGNGAAAPSGDFSMPETISLSPSSGAFFDDEIDIRARTEQLFAQALGQAQKSASAEQLKKLRAEASKDPKIAKLLHQIEQTRKKRKTALQAACKEISSSFTINQWKVNRPLAKKR